VLVWVRMCASDNRLGRAGRYTDECAPRGGQKVDALAARAKEVCAEDSPDKASDD